jgi:hypothetical protein
MISHLGSGTVDDRVLFEQAKAKLEEAFALLRSIEGRIQGVPRDPIDAAKRAEERERLLAYVEHAQHEAMRLARRSRRLSRIRLRAQPQANVQRGGEGADVIGELPSAEAAGESTAPRPGEIITEPVPALPPVLANIEEVDAGDLDPIERAFEAASKELKQRIDAERAELTPQRVARSRADTLIGPYEDLDDEAVEISDEDLKSFEDAMANTIAQTKIQWWPARAEAAESEKAGARMRRDRSPTERMERPTTQAPYYAVKARE